MTKKALLALFIGFFCIVNSNAQYYLRGEVKNELGKLLPYVKILLHSKGTYVYNSGSAGSFGIPSSVEFDTIRLSVEGYEPLQAYINCKKFQSLTMKMLPATASLYKHKLSSATKNLLKEQYSFFNANGESYSNLIENDFVAALQYPETGFALNIDRAAYSNARRFLNNDMNVPTDAVRIEEMLNYFSFSCSKNNLAANEFACNSYVTNCPWNSKTNLLFLNLCAPKLNLDSVPPSNLVFLIDISGSMDKDNRLPLLRNAFKMLTDNLRAQDKVSIVVYGGGVATVLKPTSGAEKDAIKTVIDSLTAAGDTPGEGAIRTAYNVAKKAFIPNGNNRVILATDGDFNVGETSEKALEDLISLERQSGIYLTCLGVGMGNYKDSKLETLAKKGNGNFAYIDNIYEAQKVLVTEFTKTLYSVANDAYLTLYFDSKYIREYRLIGFDNKQESIKDSTSELEGGEVGSAHSMMAIFEITPNDQQFSQGSSAFAQAVLQFKNPKTYKNITQKFAITNNYQDLQKADSSLRFATAVAMFGSLLKQSKYAKTYTFSEVYNMASGAIKIGDYAQQEFLQLVQKANRIYNPKKKKKEKER